MSTTEKVTTAFPISPQLLLDHERLRSLLSASALKSYDAQYRSRVELRALDCTKGHAIGRIDSVSSLRAMSLDPQCFRAQEADLRQYIGIRTVGALMGLPAVHPAVPLGPVRALPTPELPNTITGISAAAAGVVVLQGDRGQLTAVEIPSGKRIAKLPRLDDNVKFGSISPNGRVVALPQSGASVLFVDVETGDRIWEGEGLSQFLAWMPEIDALLVNGKNSRLSIVDVQSATLTPHPIELRPREWATPLSSKPSRVLVSSNRELEILAHERTPQGIQATLEKEYRLDTGFGIDSRAPTLMRDGKLAVFSNSHELGWLDLTTGEFGAWSMAPFFVALYAKLDESHLFVYSQQPELIWHKPWSFDVDAQTLSPIAVQGPEQGFLIELDRRRGFMLRTDRVWVGDEVKVGEAVSLASVVGELNLRAQDVALKAQMRALETQSSLRAAEDSQRIRGTGGPLPLAVPSLPGVPSDAVVHIVGVYEGAGSAVGTVDGHAIREVEVIATAPSRPVILVLSSVEPVRWIIRSDGAPRISSILVSGYHASTVAGAGNIPVARIGSAYAYLAGNDDYQKLRQQLTAYIGSREVRSFQGSYNGGGFAVGP